MNLTNENQRLPEKPAQSPAEESIPYTPESINYQLTCGNTREELARVFGHKTYRTLDVFMRRKGYTWDWEQQQYVVKAVKPKAWKGAGEEPEGAVPQRLTKALKMLKDGKNAKDTAAELGFPDHKALAQYMKDRGYHWNVDSRQYEYDPNVAAAAQQGEAAMNPEKEENTASLPASKKEITEFLMRNADYLADLFNSQSMRTLPRYRIPGYRVSKSMHVSHKLDMMIQEFCLENNIAQRELFEVSIVETLRKYGYEAEVKGLLNL